MLKNIVDGWLLNPSIRYLPYRALPMILGQLEPLRRAHNYRNWAWILPEEISAPIPARGEFKRNIRVVPNSYLWAANFRRFSVDPGPISFNPDAPIDLSFQVTDDATGVQLFSEFFPGNIFFTGNGNSLAHTSPAPLTQPRLITDPGLLSVQIANLADVVQYCQLCLYFLEPCDPRQVEQCR